MNNFFSGAARFIKSYFGAAVDPQFLELAVIAVVMLCIGTFFYSHIEGWKYLDSLYFSVTTLTTVGYGDFYPKTEAGKLFTVFYILAGVGIILGFVNAVATHTRNRSPLDKLFEKK